MSRKIKTDRTADDVQDENTAKTPKKRNEVLAKDLMYGDKAYKRTVRDTQNERDQHKAFLHSFGGASRIFMAWDLNPSAIADQVFMMKIGDQTAYLSAVEIQKYLRWV